MRKEVVLAIVIGLSLGLIIIFGIYTANQATQGQVSPLTGGPTPTIAPTPGLVNQLTIYSPQDGDLFADSTATISGQAKPGSQVIVLSESEDLVVAIDATGRFSQTVKLTKGANLIEITAVDPDGQQQSQKLNLVYTTTSYE